MKGDPAEKVKPGGWYSRKIAAEELEVNTSTIWRYVQKGYLHPRIPKVGPKLPKYSGKEIIRLKGIL